MVDANLVESAVQQKCASKGSDRAPLKLGQQILLNNPCVLASLTLVGQVLGQSTNERTFVSSSNQGKLQTNCTH